MKTSHASILSIALITVLALSSCNKDHDTTPGNDPNAVQMEFAASFAKYDTIVKAESDSIAKSKSYLQNYWSLITGSSLDTMYFDTQDLIGIFADNGKPAKFAIKNGKASDKEVTFAGNVDKANGYYALYPYQEASSINDGIIKANIPTTQSSQNNIDGNAALCVTYTSDGERNLTFRNATATLGCFANYLSITRIDIETTDGTMIAGDVDITVPQDGSTPTVSGGTSSKITINTNSGNSAVYAASLMPCTLKPGALKITYHKSDGATFTQVNDQELILQSGGCYVNGRIGDIKLTCYADASRTNILFTRFANDNNKHITLPILSIPIEDGYTYYYTTRPDGSGTSYESGQTVEITANTDLYIQKGEACHVIIYDPDGKDVLYETKVRNNKTFEFPYLSSPVDNSPYAYSFEKNGPQIDNYQINVGDKSELILYAVPESALHIRIYGNGEGQEPTVDKEISRRNSNDYIYYLPEIERTEVGYEYVYATQPDGKMVYTPGDRITDLKQDLSLYPVQIKVNEIDLSGNTTGSASNNSWASYDVAQETEPNTVSIFRFRAFVVNKHGWQLRIDFGKGYEGCKAMGGYEGEDKTTQAKYCDYGYYDQNNALENIDNSDIVLKFYNKDTLVDIKYYWKGKQEGKTLSDCYYNSLLTGNKVKFVVNGCYLVFNYKESDEQIKLIIHDEDGSIAYEKSFAKGRGEEVSLPPTKQAPDGYEYVYSTTPGGKMEYTHGYAFKMLDEDVELYLVKVKVNTISMNGLILRSDSDSQWVKYDNFPEVEPGCVTRYQYTQYKIPHNGGNYHVRFDVDGGRSGIEVGSGWVNEDGLKPAQSNSNGWSNGDPAINLEGALVTVEFYNKGETIDIKYDWKGSIDGRSYYSYAFDFPISNNKIMLTLNDALLIFE